MGAARSGRYLQTPTTGDHGAQEGPLRRGGRVRGEPAGPADDAAGQGLRAEPGGPGENGAGTQPAHPAQGQPDDHPLTAPVAPDAGATGTSRTTTDNPRGCRPAARPGACSRRDGPIERAAVARMGGTGRYRIVTCGNQRCAV